MKMAVDGVPAAPPGLPPCGSSTRGSAFGSTPRGYIPAAASRLKAFAIPPDLSVISDKAISEESVSMNPRIHNTAMKICFGQPIVGAEMSPGVATRHAESVRHVGASASRRLRGYFRRRLISMYRRTRLNRGCPTSSLSEALQQRFGCSVPHCGRRRGPPLRAVRESCPYGQ